MNIESKLLPQVAIDFSVNEVESKAILELATMMAQAIADNHPLKSLVGREIVYHKSGMDVGVEQPTILHESNLPAYSALFPHMFMHGSRLNALMETDAFNDSGYYVLYLACNGDKVVWPSGVFDEILAIKL